MRYTGPKHKLCRREGEPICGLPTCPFRRRRYPPGVHGPKQTRSRLSEYATQLRMKQKVKRTYGLTERQFARFFQQAAKSKGDAGDNLLRLLELRLDNVIYRAGLAQTRPQARQLVTHSHFEVNGRPVNIPSYILKPTDNIKLKPSKRAKAYYEEALPQATKSRASWLTWDPNQSSLVVAAEPRIQDLKSTIDTRLIVEHYSR